MNKPMKLISLLAAVGLSMAGTASYSLSMLPDTDSPEYASWKKKLDFYKYWYCSNFPEGVRQNENYLASMKMRVAPSGMITYLSVVNTSGDGQADFSCLESLSSAAPFSPMPRKQHSYGLAPPGVTQKSDFEQERYQAIIGFSAQQHPKPFPEVEDFLSKHGDLRGCCYLMHLVPLGINEHYPNLFTEDELTSKSNLIALNGNIEPDEALLPFVNGCNSLLRSTKQPTSKKY